MGRERDGARGPRCAGAGHPRRPRAGVLAARAQRAGVGGGVHGRGIRTSSSFSPSARPRTRTAASRKCSRTRSHTSSSTGRPAGVRCRGGSTRGSRCWRRARGACATRPSWRWGCCRARACRSGSWTTCSTETGGRWSTGTRSRARSCTTSSIATAPPTPRLVLARLARGDTFDEAMRGATGATPSRRRRGVLRAAGDAETLDPDPHERRGAVVRDLASRDRRGDPKAPEKGGAGGSGGSDGKRRSRAAAGRDGELEVKPPAAAAR